MKGLKKSPFALGLTKVLFIASIACLVVGILWLIIALMSSGYKGSGTELDTCLILLLSGLLLTPIFGCLHIITTAACVYIEDKLGE